MEKAHRPPRFLISALILLLFVMASYPLCMRLISQIYYQKAVNHIQDGSCEPAVNHLETAIRYQANDPLVWKKLGEAYHNLGVLMPIKEAFDFATKAKHAYLKAARCNPLDAEATYGLAREEARLEQIYPYLHHQNNPYHALPCFEEAIRLKPNSILYHYALTRYLHQQKKTGALLKVVSNMARIYPPVYGYLKKEAFWSSPVREAFKKGLQQAIDEEITSQNAHTAMSSLMAEEKDWASAISYYQKALALQAIDKDAGKYLHLGRLYVKNGQLEEAEESFFRALSMSRTKERHLEDLYWVYEREGYFEELYRFYHRVSRSFALSARMDILLARSLVDLKRYDQAQRILKELNQESPSAEAYYWLARIAEKEKDWDSMELAIQKATVLDQKNSRYHLIFSKVLKRLKKLERAEKEAGLALDYSVKPSHWLFDHRAWIRWSRKDYQGAVKDWKSAIAVKPKKASFYARAAQAYCKLGEWSHALDHYQKAMDLDPKNENYRKRYNALRAEHPDLTNPA